MEWWRSLRDHRRSLEAFCSIPVEFCGTIFYCPQIPDLSKAVSFLCHFVVLGCIFVVVRHHRLGHDYWTAVSYRLGFIALSGLGGVYSAGTHDAFWVEHRKPVPSQDGWGHLCFLYICSAFWPFLLDSNQETNSEQKFPPKSLPFHFHTVLGTISTIFLWLVLRLWLTAPLSLHPDKLNGILSQKCNTTRTTFR